MSGRLTGKSAVVTGGSSGIGKAIVTLFAQEGARVACIASADRAKAQAVADEAGKVAGEIKPFFADVSRWNEAERLIGEVNNAFGGIDILVTAAGLFIPTPIGTRAQTDTEQMIAVNLLGTIAMIDAVVPIMKKRGSGKIVSIASIAGLVGIGNYSTYCATKAGVIGLVKALAIELAPLGININAIAPGNTETPINEDISHQARIAPRLRPDEVPDTEQAGLLQGRRHGEGGALSLQRGQRGDVWLNDGSRRRFDRGALSPRDRYIHFSGNLAIDACDTGGTFTDLLSGNG